MNSSQPHLPTKLHLGCGPLAKAGWLNVDRHVPNLKLLNNNKGPLFSIWYRIEGWWKTFRTPASERIRVFDICRPFPLPENHFELIFASHVVEHLAYSGDPKDRRDSAVQNFLDQCFKCLSPDGFLRLSTPDLDLMLKKLNEKDETYFFETLISEGLPRLSSIEEAFLRVLYERSTHAYCYNFSILKKLFEQAGFVNIENMAFGQSRHPSIHKDGMDNREHESFFIEGQKPRKA